VLYALKQNINLVVYHVLGNSGVVEAFAKVVERTTPHSHASTPAISVSDTTLGVPPSNRDEQLHYLHGLF